MSLSFSKTELEGLIIIESDLYQDERGFFKEVYHSEKYKDLREVFIQDNHSNSKKGVIRGLHYQLNKPQGKLVTVITGEVFDVAVDIRKNSPSYGKYVGEILTAENKKQLLIPRGFAHGFLVLSETAIFTYKCDNFYHKESEGGIIYNDSTINIDWKIENPTLSKKDRQNPKLSETPEGLLPVSTKEKKTPR